MLAKSNREGGEKAWERNAVITAFTSTPATGAGQGKS